MKFPHGSPASLRDVLIDRYNLAFVASGQEPIGLLKDAIFAECSDSRDKVFALLGLFPPMLSEKIKPRYTGPVQEVFQEAVIAYIKCSNNLAFLALTGPSWIPDWSVPQGVMGRRGRYCSSHSAAEVSHVSPDVLMATGVTFDVIEAVVGPLPDDEEEILEMIRGVWLDVATRNERYSTGETLAEACAWTLAEGRLSDRRLNDPGVMTTLAEAQLPFQQLQEAGKSGLDPCPLYALLNHWTLNGRTLFKTTKGYLGWTFRKVLPGDKVCVLLGCSLATILREQPNGQHLFVGCAYVHGIMDGEALLGPLLDGWKVVIDFDRNDDLQQQFVDPTTGETTTVDPRLPSLPPEWEPVIAPDRFWPHKKVDAFKNTTTGQILHSDPRLLPDALRARDVPLEQFALV